MKHKLVIAMTAATLFLVGCGQRQHTEQVTLVRIDTVKTANTCDILVFRRNLLQPVSRFVVSIGGSDVLVVKRHYTFGFGLDTQIFGFDRL